MTTIRPATPHDMSIITALWERSVRASHDFLTEADIAALRPEVSHGLAMIPLWVAETDDEISGFMAMHDAMVEALFIDPAFKGKGIGTLLLSKAVSLVPPGSLLRVDVNEQNPAALGFYQAKGFAIIGRSPVDSAGRPFPLVHLSMTTPEESSG